MENNRYIISLLQLPKVGRKSAWKIVNESNRIARSAAELFENVSESKSGPPVTMQDAEKAWRNAEEILKHADEEEIDVISCTEFPEWLKYIPDPPLVLFAKGDKECITNPFGVAVIGTREPTDYGQKVAHRFAFRGAEAGCVIISGLAIGCDSLAHRGCLDAGGKTVAVLAHGLDRIYPRDSRPLADEILEKGGCLVSEYAPGTRVQRGNFIERDRLQSGLSSGVIVVETDTEGGTMHTVGFAEKQGRLLACLSHPAAKSGDAKTRGNAMLIYEGRAKPLEAADDLQIFIDSVRTTAEKWSKKEVSS